MLEFLPKASLEEFLQILESLLELSPTLGKSVRVPWGDRMPTGPMANELLDPELVQRGLIRAAPLPEEGDEEAEEAPFDPEQRPLVLAEKVAMLFEARFEGVADLQIHPVWAIGELLLGYAGNFNMYVRNCDLVRQEGLIFRHMLRMILLCEEFDAAGVERDDSAGWREMLADLATKLTKSCAGIDPASTQEVLVRPDPAEVFEEEVAPVVDKTKLLRERLKATFGAGLDDLAPSPGDLAPHSADEVPQPNPVPSEQKSES